MMCERGVSVNPSTIFRWVQRYALEIEKQVRPYQGHRSGSWQVDETYVGVGGRWRYLFRAIDNHGRLIDSMLSHRRDMGAAYRFLRKAMGAVSGHPPCSIITDRLASYPKAIRRLQGEGLLPKDVEHRTSKYLNNILEADHGTLERVIRPTRGFQTMKTAAITIGGFRGHAHDLPRPLRPEPSGRDRRNPSRQPVLRPCRLSAPVDRVRYALSKLLQQCHLTGR
jgi:IS6 family transposase